MIAITVKISKTMPEKIILKSPHSRASTKLFFKTFSRYSQQGIIYWRNWLGINKILKIKT